MSSEKVIGAILRIWGHVLLPILASFMLLSSIVTEEPIMSEAIDAAALLLTLMYLLYIALIPLWTEEKEDA